MQKTKRKALRQSDRFAVFNRDGFKCMYCGKTPDDGIKLQVDHIIPVAEGGGNEIENLTTSCFDCNIGKGKKLIGSKVKKRDIKKETKEMKDTLKIMKEYYKYLKQKRELEESTYSLKDFTEISGRDPAEHRRKDVKKLIKKYGMEIAIDARGVFVDSTIDTPAYLFGIAKNMYQKKTIEDYDKKIEFYTTYIKPYDKYNQKDFILKKEYGALIFFITHYSREAGDGECITLINKIEYMNKFKLSEYQYSKAIYSGLKDLRDDIKDSYFNSIDDTDG